MSQIDLLLKKAQENIEVAELLLREGHAEIAVSRAYYAMFYIAEILLFKKGLSFSSHSAVITAFGKDFAKTGQIDPRHHQHLKDAFETRQVGDYGIDIGITDSKAKEIITWARDFLVDAQAFLDKP